MCFRIVEGKKQRSGSHALRQGDSHPRAATPAFQLDEITGGAPYGATTIAGGDGSRQPSTSELDGARYQGRRVAEVATKIFG